MLACPAVGGGVECVGEKERAGGPVRTTSYQGCLLASLEIPVGVPYDAKCPRHTRGIRDDGKVASAAESDDWTYWGDDEYAG